MSWLNGASDLMTVAKSFYSGGTAASKQDWGNLAASAATIVGKGLIYLSKQKKVIEEAAKAGAKKAGLPTPTAIVDFAAFALILVDFLNGFGTPTTGSTLSTAKDKFDLCLQSLGTEGEAGGCYPDKRDWSGDAADAYTAKVTYLVNQVKAMKTLDATLKGYVAQQAEWAARAHLTININVAVLTAAAGIAIALYMIPIFGPEISLAWQIVAAFFCCAAVLVVEILTLSNSGTLNNDIKTQAEAYVQFGKDVETTMAGRYDRISGEVAQETLSYEKVFKDISANLKSFYAPSVVSLAAAAGESASPMQKAALKAFAENGQEFAAQGQDNAGLMSSAGVGQEAPADTFGADTTDSAPPVPSPVGAAPAAAAEAAPAAFTPPTLAQVSAMSGQVSRISQNISQPVNQTMQQVQQIASMGQQGQQPAPAEEAPADESAEVGAASGQGSSERAPVEAAKGDAAATGTERERVL